MFENRHYLPRFFFLAVKTLLLLPLSLHRTLIVGPCLSGDSLGSQGFTAFVKHQEQKW